MTPNRVATWRRPDGTLFHQGSTIDRRPADNSTDRPATDRTADEQDAVGHRAQRSRPERSDPISGDISDHELEGSQLTLI
jgi:hypothetical protein